MSMGERMMRRGIAFLAVVVAGALGAVAEPVLHQFSTLDALMKGQYAGEFAVGRVREAGLVGNGTFADLDGEMVVVDGAVFQVRADGRVERMPDRAMTPFACVAGSAADWERPTLTLEVEAGLDWEGLLAYLDARLPSLNYPYVVRMEGAFSEVRARSVPAQARPYPPLTEVVKAQTYFTLGETRGTVVGFRCPGYVGSLNVPGWHLHYLNAERNAGGHLLALRTGTGVRAKVLLLSEIALHLPRSADFEKAALGTTTHAAIQAVEKAPEARGER